MELQVFLFAAGRLDHMAIKGPFQLKQFYDPIQLEILLGDKEINSCSQRAIASLTETLEAKA